MKEIYYQYVPIKETINALFKYQSVQRQHKCTLQYQQKEGTLGDAHDSTVFKENYLYNTHPDSLKIILYQDAFEVVNLLGSARKKHKIIGVYFTLANFEPYNRSNIDHMQLAILCRESDFKEFGQNDVFSQLLTDLKDLEQNGIALENGKSLKGTLCCISGDNLGFSCNWRIC